VVLTPIPSFSMRKAIYAGNGLSISNNVNVDYHDTTNDADLYSGGDVLINNYLDLRGSIYAQGAVHVVGCVEGNVYAKGNVTTGSAFIGGCNTDAQPGADAQSGVNIYHGYGNVTSSDGTVVITSRGEAYGTCTSGMALPSVVYCSKYPKPGQPNTAYKCADVPVPAVPDPLEPCGVLNPGIADPPVVPFPSLVYNRANWTARGYTPHTYGDCASAKAALEDYLGANTASWSGDNVVEVSLGAPCALTLASRTDYLLRGNLGVIIGGSFVTSGGTAITNSGYPTHTLYMTRPTSGGGVSPSINPPSATCGVALPASPHTGDARQAPPVGTGYDQMYSTKTDFSSIYFQAYTPCAILTFNQNKSGQGQFIAGDWVFVQNSFSLGYLPVDAPDVAPAGWEAAPVFTREIHS